MHGYEIMQNITKITEGRVRVGAGTLYSLISRFENEDIVKKIATHENKKTYILTSKGKEILQEELNRLKELVRDGNMHLGE